MFGVWNRERVLTRRVFSRERHVGNNKKRGSNLKGNELSPTSSLAFSPPDNSLLRCRAFSSFPVFSTTLREFRTTKSCLWNIYTLEVIPLFSTLSVCLGRHAKEWQKRRKKERERKTESGRQKKKMTSKRKISNFCFS